MRYSDELIEEVREKNDIVDVIGDYVALKRAGSNYMGLCPFHNEKTASFSVSRTKQMYYCFGCHAGGNVFTFLMEYNNATFAEALQMLADRAGIPLPKIEYSREAQEQIDRKAALQDVNKKAAAYYYYLLRTEAGKRGLLYLTGRGLSEETIKKFGLGYSGQSGSGLYRYLKGKGYQDALLNESGLFTFSEKEGALDKFWNRVMFPIQDIQGRVIGFGGRVMGDAKPKYLNSPETMLFNKRNNLYGLNIARSSRRKYIILCEGYMDVITMHQAGFDCTAASLGTALTPQQTNLLKRYTDEVLLLYDSDGAGVMAALRAIPILKDAGISARVVNLLPYKDPDEFIKNLGPEEMEKRLSGAGNAFMFEIDNLSKGYRLDDPQDRTAFQHEAAKKLLAFPEELERTNYIDAISARYSFPAEGLKKLVNTYALAGIPSVASPPVRQEKKTEKPENSIVKSQKLMLTYLANYPEAYKETKDIVGPDDFSDPLCREIADNLYRQLAGGSVSEARLVNLFIEAEKQKEIARLFNTTIPVKTESEQDRAFTDTVLRLLENRNREDMNAWDGRDSAVLQKLIEQKKRLEEFTSGKKVLHLPYHIENEQEKKK